jgi:hypothetical protein
MTQTATIAAPAPGVYEGTAEIDYRGWPAMNYSLLKYIALATPAHFKAAQERPRTRTPEMRKGQIGHVMLLEPFAFESRYLVIPDVDKRTKAGKEAYAAAQTEAGNREIVEQSDYADIQIGRAHV